MNLDWYDSLVRGATVSLARMFDPNYAAVQAATMPSPYSDSRGMSLEEMFKHKMPMLHDRNQHTPFMGDDGWRINRIPVDNPMNRVVKHPYEGML